MNSQEFLEYRREHAKFHPFVLISGYNWSITPSLRENVESCLKPRGRKEFLDRYRNEPYLAFLIEEYRPADVEGLYVEWVPQEDVPFYNVTDGGAPSNSTKT